MNVKRGARGFSTLPDLTKASRRHFPLQPICVERKEVLTIVGHSMFLASTVVDHQRAVTRRIIKINPLDEAICTALRLRDNRKRKLSEEDYFVVLGCEAGDVAPFYFTPLVKALRVKGLSISHMSFPV